VAATLQRILDEVTTPLMVSWIDDELEDDGAEPWALGDGDAEPLAVWDDAGGGDAADGWLDEQLGRLHPGAGPAEADLDGPASAVAVVEDRGEPDPFGLDGVVLRRPAPGRPPRRRRADPAVATDIPVVDVPGYVRDRRGTWRYAATGQAVPGARDLTLRSLYRFPIHRGQVLVPVALARTEAELGWCLAWTHTLTTRLAGRRLTTVLRIPVGEWERRADLPFGLWAPELTASRVLCIADVARLAGVSPATITAYLSRRQMPPPVARLGHTPVWSRPVIAEWLATRPGQGARRPTLNRPAATTR
jgi:predicted DNA-binding transcriptional regulator AlpA